MIARTTKTSHVMQQRPLPGTDLSVSFLAFGNFMFGTNWWGEFSDADGIALQNQAFDLGCNFFDTAPAYGNGRAEGLMRGTLDYAGRDNLVITTKFGYDFYHDPGDPRKGGGHRERRQNFTPDFIRFECEKSLERMGIDHIDLYQAHNLKLPDYTDELVDTMHALKREGKIGAWGVALGPAIGWREEGIRALIDDEADVVQTVFNLYEQAPGRELCEIVAAQGKGGIIARVPTNSGMLDDEFKSPDHQFESWDHRKFRDRDWLVYGIKKNDIVRPMAAKLGLSLRRFAIKWLASVPGMLAVEPNILNADDLAEYASACDGSTLDADLLAELQTLYDTDFGLGAGAHPCDIKSSVADEGKVRSQYVRPPTFAHHPQAEG